MSTYKIVRYFQNAPKRTILCGLTLEEARAHCQDPESSYKTATSSAAQARTRLLGPWFDGFSKE